MLRGTPSAGIQGGVRAIPGNLGTDLYVYNVLVFLSNSTITLKLLCLNENRHVAFSQHETFRVRLGNNVSDADAHTCFSLGPSHVKTQRLKTHTRQT